MSFKKEATLYNLFHSDKNYRKEAKELRKKYPDAKTLLEIGAGTGLLTKELVKLGFKVTCIEPSSEMLALWSIKGVERINAKLEDVPLKRFKRNQFDLLVAHYDVLNYIDNDCFGEQARKLLRWAENYSTEVWSGTSVKPFTYKFKKGWHRVRLGFRVGTKVHLWFIYFGKGFLVEKHTLYL